jgi:hypothetical protein
MPATNNQPKYINDNLKVLLFFLPIKFDKLVLDITDKVPMVVVPIFINGILTVSDMATVEVATPVCIAVVIPKNALNGNVSLNSK